MNSYNTKFFAFCPVNNVRVEYDWTVQTADTLKVEDLIDAVTLLNRGLHEDFAGQLFREFGGAQTLTAHHHGVTIRTERP
jgi:hypothetical protein